MKYSGNIKGSSARAAVRTLLTEEFVTAFAAEIPVRLLSSVVTEEQPDTWQHVMSCEFDTSGFDLNGAVRKFLPSIVKLTWQQTWTVQDDTHATVVLKITTEGSPSATTSGDAALVVDGDELTFSYEGKTKVSVPLVGGKLADLVDEHVVEHVLDAQLAVLARTI